MSQDQPRSALSDAYDDLLPVVAIYHNLARLGFAIASIGMALRDGVARTQPADITSPAA